MEELENQLGGNIENWTWDKVHTIEHAHTLGQDPNLARLLNVGPFPVVDNNEVINNMAFHPTANGQYEVKSGPALRRIVDFSDWERGVSVLPTGQSGNPMSPHYQDQAALFVNEKFRTEMMNKEEIIKESKLLKLVPR